MVPGFDCPGDGYRDGRLGCFACSYAAERPIPQARQPRPPGGIPTGGAGTLGAPLHPMICAEDTDGWSDIGVLPQLVLTRPSKWGYSPSARTP
jgi:hypothetical protein